jgi:hypothetical protein
MADQSIARATEISRPHSNEAHQQIGIDVEKNTGWPQPTRAKNQVLLKSVLRKIAAL